MAPLHAPDKSWVHLVLCTAFHLHKQLDKTSCSGFFCSSLCLLFLLIFLPRLSHCNVLGARVAHPLTNILAHGLFLETCVQTHKAVPLPTRCVWVCQEQIINYWQGEKSPGWRRPWRYPESVSSEVPARIEMWLLQWVTERGVTSGWQPVTSGVSLRPSALQQLHKHLGHRS